MVKKYFCERPSAMRVASGAGTGKAKRRTKEQYQEMARKSAEVRRKRATDRNRSGKK